LKFDGSFVKDSGDSTFKLRQMTRGTKRFASGLIWVGKINSEGVSMSNPNQNDQNQNQGDQQQQGGQNKPGQQQGGQQQGGQQQGGQNKPGQQGGQQR
jgi:hypothetical protein